MLDDPIGGAADGFVALHQGNVHIGLDLFEGLLGAVSALLQVLVDLLFGGNEGFVLRDLQQSHPGAGVLLGGGVDVGREVLAGLVDLAQVAVEAQPLHLKLLLDVLHLMLVGALHQNAGQLALGGGRQLGQDLILGAVQGAGVLAVIQLLADLLPELLHVSTLPTFLAKSLFRAGSWRTQTSSSLILKTVGLPARSFT